MLPVYDLIKYFLLFCTAAMKVYPGGLDAFVPQDVGEHGDVVAALDKASCEQMAEGMGIQNGRVQTEAGAQLLDTIADAVGADGVPAVVQEDMSGFSADLGEPF